MKRWLVMSESTEDRVILLSVERYRRQAMFLERRMEELHLAAGYPFAEAVSKALIECGALSESGADDPAPR